MKKLFFLFLISFTVFLLPQDAYSQDKQTQKEIVVRKTIKEFTKSVMNSEEFIAIMKKGNNATDSDIEVFGNSLSPKFKALGKQARKLKLSLEEFKSLADTNVDLIEVIENAQYRAIIPNDKACATSMVVETVGQAIPNGAVMWLAGLVGQWVHCD